MFMLRTFDPKKMTLRYMCRIELAKIKIELFTRNFSGQRHSQFKRFTEKSLKITNKISRVPLFNRVFGFIIMLYETDFIYM